MPNPKLETYKSKKTGVIYDYTDADAQSQLTGIKDGTSIDSFADVESALAGKASASDVASRVDWSSYAVTGVNNFWGVKLSDVKTLNTSGTWAGNKYTLNNIEFTFSENNGYVSTIAVSGTSSAQATVTMPAITGLNGNFKQNGGVSTTVNITSKKNNNWTNLYSYGKTSAYDISLVATDTYSVVLNVNATGIVVNDVFYPMLYPENCDGDVYASYAMTNGQITGELNRLNDTPIAIPSGADLDNYYISGDYEAPTGAIASSLIHKPSDLSLAFQMKVIARPFGRGGGDALANVTQIIYCINTNTSEMYIRRKAYNSSFGSWYKFTGTAV